MATRPSLRRAAGALCACAAAGLLATCSPEAPPAARNVLLIAVDSLRPDRLGCYGAERDTSPYLDALAAEGVRFARAYTTAPWTMPGVASILSGRYPSSHGATSPTAALPDSVDTLAELLAAQGFQTSAVISNRLISARFAFDQGFASFDAEHAGDKRYISTAGVTETAIGELERFASQEAPFLLFAFYFDPHYDWRDHPGTGWAPPDAGRLDGDETIHELRALEDMTAEELAFIRARYDEEVRHTDDGLGRLLTRLDELGLGDDTVIVFVADHGEAFFDHGWLGHVRDLYEELVRVPLVIRAPGCSAGAVVDTPVSVVSLLPTLLELVGAPPAPGAEGASLLAALSGGSAPEQPLYFEVDFQPADPRNADKEAHKVGVLAGDRKLIRDEATGAVEVFALDADPEERSSLAASADRDAMLRLIERHQGRAAAGAQGVDVELTDAEVEEMRDLGYAGD